MYEVIKHKLEEIEQREGIVMLHAVESGSRAWGFASPDSDYDVRFIYLREPEFYLRLGKTHDVLECQLDETLDINGWDLQKMLRLLRKSNPTLFEWASSPIVYLTTPEWEPIKRLLPDYFLSKHGVYHYLSMAEGNYREYLKRDTVKVKKYLYVLRPLLACKWILEKQSPPPMLFSELVASEAGDELAMEIRRLLDIKINSPETLEMQFIEPLNAYIDEAIPLLREQVEALPTVKPKGYDELDNLFIETLYRNLK
ncbi:MAG: nucleotidyltransferase domain-containing protein [Oscillospiraceae bacterium]|nr:nucleotidyltransferase domain-containing protein [Oscillospiraceae bacterium]